MAKKSSKPKVSAKKSGSKPRSAAPARASRPPAEEKFRDIDRSSVSNLILTSMIKEPDGVSADDLKAQLMERFGQAVDANLTALRREKRIKTAGGRLALRLDSSSAGGNDLIRKMVCLVLCQVPGRALDEGEVTAGVRGIDSGVTPADVRLALDSLCRGSGGCVRLQSGRYLRDCTVTCPCD